MGTRTHSGDLDGKVGESRSFLSRVTGNEGRGESGEGRQEQAEKELSESVYEFPAAAVANLPPPGWLKPTEMSSPTVLKATAPSQCPWAEVTVPAGLRCPWRPCEPITRLFPLPVALAFLHWWAHPATVKANLFTALFALPPVMSDLPPLLL